MNHLYIYISWESWDTASTESVLVLQLNFDSNAQIKKQNKNRGTLTFFVSKMFEEKNGVTLYCDLLDSYSGLYFMGKSSKNIEKWIDQPLDSGRCCLSIRQNHDRSFASNETRTKTSTLPAKIGIETLKDRNCETARYIFNNPRK